MTFFDMCDFALFQCKHQTKIIVYCVVNVIKLLSTNAQVRGRTFLTKLASVSS